MLNILQVDTKIKLGLDVYQKKKNHLHLPRQKYQIISELLSSGQQEHICFIIK